MQINNVKLDWNSILEKHVDKLQEMYPENDVRQAYGNIISLLNDNKIKSRVIINGNRAICYAFIVDYSGFNDRLYAVMGFEDAGYVEDSRIENLVSWMEKEGKESRKSVVVGDIYNSNPRVEEFLSSGGFKRLERIRLELKLDNYTQEMPDDGGYVFDGIYSVTPGAYSDAEYRAFLGGDDIILFPAEHEQRVLFTSQIFDGRLGKIIPEASAVIKDGEKIIAAILSVEAGSTVNSDKRALIADIFVDNDYRKNGLGKLILARSLSALRTLGFNSVILWVSTNNPARSLYDKFSFRDMGYGREISYFISIK